MKNDLVYFVLALTTGALIPIQASTNAVFSKTVGSPTVAGLMVFIIGLVGVIIYALISRTTLPAPKQLAAAPLYSYLGGLIVAAYVIMITILVPRIGVGPAIAFIVTGQIICAVVIDHFGLFNVAVRPADASRIIGVLLMIGGIYFVMKK